MSHFTVLVIGPEAKKQLAPFHEFECTGYNDEYIQDVDVTEDVLKESAEDSGELNLNEGLSYYGLEDRVVEDESEVQKLGKDAPHQYGYAVVKDGKLIKAVQRTNPNRKWDWYQIGGRWSGFLKLKEQGQGKLGDRSLIAMMHDPAGGPTTEYADVARKGDVDFEAMRDTAGNKAAEKYDLVMAAIGDKLEGFTPWDKIREAYAGNIEGAQEVYHAQSAVKALRDKSMMNKVGWSESPDDFLVTREEYIQGARDSAVSTFAVLKDGTWYERGEMGWWAMVANEKANDEWNKEFSKLIDSLPDDTLLTVVDCHI